MDGGMDGWMDGEKKKRRGGRRGGEGMDGACGWGLNGHRTRLIFLLYFYQYYDPAILLLIGCARMQE